MFTERIFKLPTSERSSTQKTIYISYPTNKKKQFAGTKKKQQQKIATK